MAKKRQAPVDVSPPITPSRAIRLFQFVSLLGQKPQTRDFLTKKLALGLRDFYRDLETLRKVGVQVSQEQGRYSLQMPLKDATALLPFPDPSLSLGEAETLAKGKTAIHKKLKDKIEAFKSPPKSKSSKRKKD